VARRHFIFGVVVAEQHQRGRPGLLETGLFAWFVPIPQTTDEALWLVRRIVDAFGLPQFAPPRLDGGLRYALPWLYTLVALVGFGVS
jgi:hypothetical protein